MGGLSASVTEPDMEQEAPQPQDNLRIFLKHLYAECVYRYQNDTYDDPMTETATGESTGGYVICHAMPHDVVP